MLSSQYLFAPVEIARFEGAIQGLAVRTRHLKKCSFDCPGSFDCLAWWLCCCFSNSSKSKGKQSDAAVGGSSSTSSRFLFKTIYQFFSELPFPLMLNFVKLVAVTGLAVGPLAPAIRPTPCVRVRGACGWAVPGCGKSRRGPALLLCCLAPPPLLPPGFAFRFAQPSSAQAPPLFRSW